MADHKLDVTIVTPDGSVYDKKDATMIVLKTTGGDIGVMANHVPVVAGLKIDAVKVKFDDSEDEIAVNGGFVEFSNNVATIVADSAETPDDIDIERAQDAKDRAEQHIAHAKEVSDKDELARAEVALKRAINRLKLSEN
ncbi:F0F1 ATP synthase subunit epsilon [Paucilactobacillus suebicus]|uniref:ATP synthase epsilon chain n=1 Tax=Paucilactobacillus suebicus DSM 5007 = KCTC 3549 TaxID=1423807 RepID=A0A0R1W740_9LACO|nr:F0F1 ATP synthase subunit epsilon [Paucilactobacillus suebicus]KRM13514.1 F0F1 ATP synthase subunit epsilon [Paucilactobacillus suebicus DSM 5007 = KCTC 3549]